MSHQSGITASPELLALFSEAYSSDTLRLIKIGIKDELMVAESTSDVAGDWEADYDAAVLPLLDETAPAFILYKHDDKNDFGYTFILVSYTPDFAHVRSKMLYASTRATLKTLFGTVYIKDELFGSTLADVSLAGYHKHKQHVDAPAPLTSAEVEKAEIKAKETGVHIGASTKKTIATGVEFPMVEEALAQIERLKAGEINYVQLALDIKNEIIQLAHAGDINVDSISPLIPDDAARYHVFVYRHSHEGDQLTSIVFLYSCPGYNCPVKERMLYASCKGPLVDALEQDHGIVFEKKLEIGGSADFSQAFLYDQLHPKKQAFTQKFARPKRPGKGGSRLTTAGKSGEDQGDGDE